MNKDNIQELLKPRYLVSTPWYPSNNYQSGDIVTPDKFTGWHPKYSPVIFRLEWWEDRDVKDMPEYLQRNTKDKIIFKAVKHNVDATHGLGFVTSEGKIKSYCNYLPATETEYLNQTNQP